MWIFYVLTYQLLNFYKIAQSMVSARGVRGITSRKGVMEVEKLD